MDVGMGGQDVQPWDSGRLRLPPSAASPQVGNRSSPGTAGWARGARSRVSSRRRAIEVLTSRSSGSPAPSGPRLAFPLVFVSPASSRRGDGCAWRPGGVGGGEPTRAVMKEPGGEIAGAGDVSQLPRKGVPGTPLRGPGEGGREGGTISDPGHFL